MPVYARIQDGRVAEVIRGPPSVLPSARLAEYVDISGLDPVPEVGWRPKQGMSFPPAAKSTVSESRS